MKLFLVKNNKIKQPTLRWLTVVIYMFVDIILCWEDLAHRSKKSLQHKQVSLLITYTWRHVQVERHATSGNVSTNPCQLDVQDYSLLFESLWRKTNVYLFKKKGRHIRQAKQACINMNHSSYLKITVMMFGATCSQAKLATDILTLLFKSLS